MWYLYVVFYTTAAVWVPLIALLFYLTREHHLAKTTRTPQLLIMVLLTISAIFRCVWFFLVPWGDQKQRIFLIVVNRCAILLQATAITLLLFMWMRTVQALEIQAEDRRSHTFTERSLRTVSVIEAEIIRNAKRKASLQQRLEIIAALGVLTMWIAVFVTADPYIIGGDSSLIYKINLCGLSIITFILACITLHVGLRTSMTIHNFVAEEAAITGNRNRSTNTQTNERKITLCEQYCLPCMNSISCGTAAKIYNVYAPCEPDISMRLLLQREAVKSILSVSIVCWICFLGQSLCFLYGPVFYHGLDYEVGYQEYSYISYPWLYYVVPEFFPTLAISLGIATPSSIMRRYISPWLNFVIKGFFVSCLCIRREKAAGESIEDSQNLQKLDTRTRAHKLTCISKSIILDPAAMVQMNRTTPSPSHQVPPQQVQAESAGSLPADGEGMGTKKDSSGELFKDSVYERDSGIWAMDPATIKGGNGRSLMPDSNVVQNPIIVTNPSPVSGSDRVTTTIRSAGTDTSTSTTTKTGTWTSTTSTWWGGLLRRKDTAESMHSAHAYSTDQSSASLSALENQIENEEPLTRVVSGSTANAISKDRESIALEMLYNLNSQPMTFQIFSDANSFRPMSREGQQLSDNMSSQISEREDL